MKIALFSLVFLFSCKIINVKHDISRVSNCDFSTVLDFEGVEFSDEKVIHKRILLSDSIIKLFGLNNLIKYQEDCVKNKEGIDKVFISFECASLKLKTEIKGKVIFSNIYKIEGVEEYRVVTCQINYTNGGFDEYNFIFKFDKQKWVVFYYEQNG